MFSTVEQVGLQVGAEKEAVAPEGNPEAEKETVWLLPEVRFAVMEFEAEEPELTEMLPELVTEKSNGGAVTEVIAKEPLASALGLYPLLKALAFTTALVVNLSIPVYGFEDGVGVEPSVV
jgi:hypothetical protein